MKDLDSILADLRRLQPELKARYPIQDVAVFGSYFRGEQTAASDLDLLIDLGPGLTLVDVARLRKSVVMMSSSCMRVRRNAPRRRAGRPGHHPASTRPDRLLPSAD